MIMVVVACVVIVTVTLMVVNVAGVVMCMKNDHFVSVVSSLIYFAFQFIVT